MSRLKSSSQCGLSVQSLIAWYINQPDQPDDSQFVSGEASSLQVGSDSVPDSEVFWIQIRIQGPKKELKCQITTK